MRRAVVALLLVPLALAACGGSKSGSGKASTPLDAVKAAAEKTTAAKSESMRLSVQATSGGQSVSATGTGAFDTSKAIGSMQLRIDAGPIATSFDEIFTGTSLYLKSPLLGGQLPGGKTWVKVDLAKVAKTSGQGIQALLGQNPSDQLKNLKYLKSATKVGTEQVGGVSTTHYTAQLDTSKLPASVKKTGLTSYDVWVGDDGYIHRVKLRAGGANVTVDLADFGKPVSASPPPAAQVYEPTSGSLPGLGG